LAPVPASRMDTIAHGPMRVPQHQPVQPRRRHWPLLLLGTVLLILAGVVGWPYVDPSTAEVPKLTGLTLDEARKQVEAAGLRLDESDPVESTTVKRDVIAVQTPGPGGQIRRSKAIVVQVSKGPKLIRLPALEGRSESQAKKELDSLGLEVDPRREDSDSVTRGRVIRTEPGAGEEAPQGSSVRLIVSAGTPIVAIPDLEGESFEDAKRALEQLGLKVERHDVPARDEDAGRVVGTDPGNGREVERGDTVEVFVSQDLVRVPNVRGDDRDEAEQRLREEGLDVQVVGGGILNGRVVEQHPRGGERVPPESTVTIFLGLGNGGGGDGG
jgi:eukaryotic-like serine/threonine-protein kinase